MTIIFFINQLVVTCGAMGYIHMKWVQNKDLLTGLSVIITTGCIGICLAIGPVGADRSATDPLSIHTGNCHLGILHHTMTHWTTLQLL